MSCGVGNAQLSRWYWDQSRQQCLSFIYKGQRGTQNNFLSKQDCERTCYGKSQYMNITSRYVKLLNQLEQKPLSLFSLGSLFPVLCFVRFDDETLRSKSFFVRNTNFPNSPCRDYCTSYELSSYVSTRKYGFRS